MATDRENLKAFYQQALEEVKKNYTGAERNAARKALGDWVSSQFDKIEKSERAELDALRKKGQDTVNRMKRLREETEAKRAQWARDKANIVTPGQKQEYSRLVSAMDKARSSGMPTDDLERQMNAFFGRNAEIAASGKLPTGDEYDPASARRIAAANAEYADEQAKKELARQQAAAVKAARNAKIESTKSVAETPVKKQSVAETFVSPTKTEEVKTVESPPAKKQTSIAPAENKSFASRAAPTGLAAIAQSAAPAATTPTRTAASFSSRLFGSARAPSSLPQQINVPSTRQAIAQPQVKVAAPQIRTPEQLNSAFRGSQRVQPINQTTAMTQRPMVQAPKINAPTQAKPFKKGGQVKSTKPKVVKVTASKRADGIAQRGKTRGRIR